jgi:hypothetical protein
MWPVDGVVGRERRPLVLDGGGKLQRRFAQSADVRRENRQRLDAAAAAILAAVPGTALASDQPYRELDLAIDFCEDVPPLGMDAVDRIVRAFTDAGATCKVSSIHVNGWFGDFDKLSGFRRFHADAGERTSTSRAGRSSATRRTTSRCSARFRSASACETSSASSIDSCTSPRGSPTPRAATVRRRRARDSALAGRAARRSGRVPLRTRFGTERRGRALLFRGLLGRQVSRTCAASAATGTTIVAAPMRSVPVSVRTCSCRVGRELDLGTRQVIAHQGTTT